jgi:homocitrate synthase
MTAPTIPNLTIVDTTLREGEQFIRARFTSEQRLQIARQLNAFGVDIIEVSSPRISPQTASDVRAIISLGLPARIVAHVRCVEEDVEAAIEAGVSGVNLFFGTSPQLRAHSHGKSLEIITEAATRYITRVREAGRYVRFSAEDAFRTPLEDLLPVIDAACEAGAHRIGLPDTVGIATPWLVAERVGLIHARHPHIGIEFHGHNDTGCAIANALAALSAGADCIDVTVLGIGERNGITSLSGLVAAVYPRWPDYLARYNLRTLPVLDQAVAEMLSMSIPFNNPITSETAFAHRAGVHTNAVLRVPDTYEVLDPEHFGLARHIDTTSRLIGWHALIDRATTIGISLSREQAQAATARIKGMADDCHLSQSHVDDIIRQFANVNA